MTLCALCGFKEVTLYILTWPNVPYVVKIEAANSTTTPKKTTSHNPVYVPTYTDHLPISHIPDRNRNNRLHPFALYKYS